MNNQNNRVGPAMIKMTSKLDTNLENVFPFIFNNGPRKDEVFETSLYICQNATCRCDVMDIKMRIKDKIMDSNNAIQYKFTINAFKQNVVHDSGTKFSLVNRNFANAFVDDLNAADWLKLVSISRTYKMWRIGKCSPGDVDYKFPWQKIEKDNIMIYYKDVFPHTQELTFINGTSKFYLMTNIA